MKIYKNKTILITGGTGTFGQAYASSLLRYNKVKKVIIFSRDELKQSEMALKFNNTASDVIAREVPNPELVSVTLEQLDALEAAI